MIPKISVILVCYRQEDVIARAIESVIVQKDYLFELYISDDCSPDKTWEVIQHYAKLYPEKITAYQHEKNQGPYENFQSTYNSVNGDIIFFLSGDDTLGKDLLQSTTKLLKKKSLHYSDGKFCILTNYKIVKSNGDEQIITTNNLVNKHNHFKLKYRGIVNNRALGESKAIFNERKKNIIERKDNAKIPSSLQEGFFDIFPFYMADNIYYLDVVGNIYYSGIGISTKLENNKEEYLKGQIEYCRRSPEYFPFIDRYDLNWLKYHEIKSQFLLKPSLGGYIKYSFRFLILTFDPLRKYFIKRELKMFVRSFKLLFTKIKY